MCDAGEKHPGRVTTLGGGIFLGICLHVCPRPGPNHPYIRGVGVLVRGLGLYGYIAREILVGLEFWDGRVGKSKRVSSSSSSQKQLEGHL